MGWGWCLLQEKLPNMILLETSRGLLDTPIPIQEKVGETAEQEDQLSGVGREDGDMGMDMFRQVQGIWEGSRHLRLRKLP